jgi:2-polyprenyl-3-methyl-5-hydroxy-6-metoxy-1,4-benzoquinol methylase
MLLKTICPFCNRASSKYWFTHTSKADLSQYDLNRCEKCKSAFVFPAPSEEYLKEFYSGEMNSHGGDFDNADAQKNYELILNLEDSFPNSRVDAKRIASFCKKLSSGNDFLDIGAGYGFFTNEAISVGFNCKAIEAGSNNCKVFKLMNGFEPFNQMFDEKFAEDNCNKFDVVLLSQVLEHIPNPQSAIKNIRTVLKSGGICVIAVPHFGSMVSKLQGKKDMFIIPPEHLNFFSLSGLNQAFKNNGFSVLMTHTVSRFDANKLKSRIKSLFLSRLIYSLIASGLHISDVANRGMFINSYFKKEHQDV